MRTRFASEDCQCITIDMTNGGLVTIGWLLGLDCWLFPSSGGSGCRFLCKRFDAHVGRPANPTKECRLVQRWALETRDSADANHGLGGVFWRSSAEQFQLRPLVNPTRFSSPQKPLPFLGEVFLEMIRLLYRGASANRLIFNWSWLVYRMALLHPNRNLPRHFESR